MKSQGNCIVSAVIDMTGKENNVALLYTDAQLVSFHKRSHWMLDGVFSLTWKSGKTLPQEVLDKNSPICNVKSYC